MYARRAGFDLFHGTNFDVPLWKKRRSVVTIHDLSALLHPEKHRSRLVRRARLRLPLVARVADMIITPTESVKREVCRRFNVKAEKVSAIHLAARQSFQPVPFAQTAEIRKRLGIEDEFLLFVGTLEPRKNLGMLVAAYGRLSEIRVPTLVIVGSLDNPDIHRIVDRLARDVPGARKVVIEGAGHMVNMEEPARFSEIVLGFLRGLTGKSGVSSPKASAAGSESSDVKAAVEALRDAGLRRDVEALERLYTPDYFHTNPDGSTMVREQVLDSYRTKPEVTIISVEADEWKAILHGPFAVASERVALHGRSADGNPFVSRYRVTYVLERRGRSWCFVNSHSSLLGIERDPSTP